jgi:hypothetical protein
LRNFFDEAAGAAAGTCRLRFAYPTTNGSPPVKRRSSQVGCNAVARSFKEFAMLTLHNSKPIISRVAASLKFAVLLILLGLIVVATERPMLLTPAGAVTIADDAAYVADQAKAKASASAAPTASAAAVPAADEFKYFPSQFAAPTGPVVELPSQF